MSDFDVLLNRQKDRAIASILGVKERECDVFLTPEASKALRKAVLDQLNEFTLFVADLMKSMDDGRVVLNEIYLDKIDRMAEFLLEK